jgi:hypothetical protein
MRIAMFNLECADLKPGKNLVCLLNGGYPLIPGERIGIPFGEAIVTQVDVMHFSEITEDMLRFCRLTTPSELAAYMHKRYLGFTEDKIVTLLEFVPV